MKKEKEEILVGYFKQCKQRKMGVMPYSEGMKTITFVWHSKGFGREAKLWLTKEGMKEALRLHEEIVKLNKEKKK